VILSVVIATYNMQREAPRTLLSSLPPLQRHVDGIEYEVILIDNGSAAPLSVGGVDPMGVPVRVVRVPPEDAAASPVFCINEAVDRHARGRFLLVCIDGARLLSSHLVRRTVDTLSRHPDAFTFVGSRHLGFEKQMISVPGGYDAAAEDALLRSVEWRSDLDALWGISVWAGAHEPENVLWQNESNAFGLERSLWQSLRGYHPGFRRPGGGLCNLEFFERAVRRGRGVNILLYGESTFHQVHGGAATASAAYYAESLAEYEAAAGRSYRRPRFDFLADLGAPYRRMQCVGRHLCG